MNLADSLPLHPLLQLIQLVQRGQWARLFTLRAHGMIAAVRAVVVAPVGVLALRAGQALDGFVQIGEAVYVHLVAFIVALFHQPSKSIRLHVIRHGPVTPRLPPSVYPLLFAALHLSQERLRHVSAPSVCQAKPYTWRATRARFLSVTAAYDAQIAR